MASGTASDASIRHVAIGDVRTSDVALGVLVAVLAVGGTASAIASSGAPVDRHPSAVAPGEALVEIRPVFVPVRRQPQEPSMPEVALDGAPPVPGVPGMVATLVPPRPGDAPRVAPDAPLPERPVGGIKALPRLKPPRGGVGGGDEPGFGPGGPAVEPGTADPAKSPNDPYAYVDPATEDPTAPPGSGVVADDKEPTGELAARAVIAYRQRLQRWLSSRFSVSGTGLPLAELLRAKVRAKLEVAENRTVTGFKVVEGGHPALEAAAARALEAAMGKQVPEPPAHYPGPLQRWISVTFVCTEDTCD